MSATSGMLASAIVDVVEAGADVINVSAALVGGSAAGERLLSAALDYAAQRGVITVAAAGNQRSLAGSAITRHPWVIPVVACNLRGHPTDPSNLSISIGRSGLRAPGDRITSLGSVREPVTRSGTSAATPFVTGTIALLISEYRAVGPSDAVRAVRNAGGRRSTVVPPLLDAWSSFRAIGFPRLVSGAR